MPFVNKSEVRLLVADQVTVTVANRCEAQQKRLEKRIEKTRLLSADSQHVEASPRQLAAGRNEIQIRLLYSWYTVMMSMSVAARH